MGDIYYGLVVVICAIEVAKAARSLRARLVRLLLFLGVGLIHGVVPLIGPDYAIGAWTPSDDALETAPLITLAGVLVMWLAWLITDHLTSRVVPARWPTVRTLEPGLQRAAWNVARLSAVLGAGGMVLVFVSSAGSVSAYTEGARFEYRASGGVVGLIALQFVALATVPAFLAFIIQRRRHRIILVSYALAFAGYYYFATRGTRSIPIGVLGALLVGYVLSRNVQRRVAVFAVFVTVAGVLFASGLYVVRRDLGQFSVAETASRLTDIDTYREAVNTDPLNYHGAFLAAIDHYDDSEDSLDGATYRRILFAPLPSAAAPGLKPPDTHITFGESVVGVGTTVSIPPSIPGDGWINFRGAVGAVLIMGVWGVAGALVDRRLAMHAGWALFIGPTLVRVLILFLRGQPYEVLVIGVFMWVSVSVLYRVSGLPVRAPGGKERFRTQPGPIYMPVERRA